MFRNNVIFYGEDLKPPRPTPKLEDHHLSDVHDYLFIIFAGKQVKVKVKVAKRGFIQHCSLKKPIVLLHPDVVPSFISRGATTPSGARALC
jgi:hypothetical protein